MTPPAEADGDGSMETILASIRRIIREDEVGPAPAPAADIAVEEDDDEPLVLQQSMMVGPTTAEEATVSADIPLSGASFDAAELAAALFDDPPPAPVPVTIAAAPPPVVVLPVAVPVPQPVPQPPREAMPPTPIQAPAAMADEPLLAPQAAALASQALASLQEAVRPSPLPVEMRLLRSGGPTIEDLVRDELRGQLKLWLDTHLPPMVERLVRQEIERLVRPG